jgi:hypothetical protein
VLCDTVQYEDCENIEVAQTEYVISIECEWNNINWWMS